MSSRQLRKLQQQRELERAQRANQGDADESEDDEQPLQPTSKPRPNLFAALGASGGDPDEEDDEGDGDDGTPLADPTERPDDELASTGAKESVKKKKKKKKKKKEKEKEKKKKAKSATNDNTDPAANAPSDDDDEIDRALRQLRPGPNSPTQGGSLASEQHGLSSGAGQTRRVNELLSINTRHLRAVHEMRTLFGREAIESAAAAEEQAASSGRRRQRAPQQVDLETFLREPPGAKKLPGVSLRRNVFVRGRDHWPCQSAGGLGMVEVGGRSGDGLSREYAYVHDEEYDGVQALFFACVQMGDPMRMVDLLKRVPYHVSTLLQVSSVARQDQNMALAAELLERALFAFGRVTTSAFRRDMENGRARLDFRRPENRQFWLAGYHYLRSLVRKGTYRTALEWAKLLYALDPADPYAVRHYMHVLALRAHEPAWLVDFFEQQLDGNGSYHPGNVYPRQSLVLAKLQLNDPDGARDLLETGIRTLPWLYCALFQELNLDAPPSIWGVGPPTDAASFWTRLYVYQAKDLWNKARATTLLLQHAAHGRKKVDVSSPAADDDPLVDLPSARLAHLEGDTSLLALTPRHLLDCQPNYEFDPLPPPEHDNIFTGEGTRLPWREGGSRPSGGQVGDELLARMQNLLARRAARAAGAGGMGGMMMNNLGGLDGGDQDDQDDEIRALRAADDEELQRDIEAHVNWGNGPGVLGTVLRMLGLAGEGSHGRGEEEEEEEEEEDDDDDDDDDDEGGGGGAVDVPGSWPDGDDGE